MHAEHRAQVAEGAGLLELAHALGGVELDVALGEAEVELAGLDGVDVEHRAAGRFDRAADAVLGAVLVDQAADRAAGRVVHAGDAAGADGDELLLGHRPARRRRRSATAATRGERDARRLMVMTAPEWGPRRWVPSVQSRDDIGFSRPMRTAGNTVSALRASLSDDLFELAAVHDERRGEEHVVAPLPVDRAAHRIAHQAVGHAHRP